MCRVMIPRQDLSEQLQAAVVQVCRGNINYTDHLDICGYITVIADGQTLSSFEFHKNIQSDRESDVQMSSIHPKLLSSQSSAGSDSSETSPSEDPETDLVIEKQEVDAVKKDLPSDGCHGAKVTIATSNTASVDAALYPFLHNSPYKCHKCDQTFRNAKVLATHQRSHQGERLYSCEDCGQEFAHVSSLCRHKKTHQPDNPFKCDYCLQTFRCDKVLQTHLRSHLGEKLFTCEHCGQQFAHSSSLCRHRKSHMGHEANPYKCDVCQRLFTSSFNLKQHVRTHTGEKPYTCDECGASFSYSHSLNAHRKTHQGDKSLACDRCGITFTQALQLEQHRLLRKCHHENSCEEEEENEENEEEEMEEEEEVEGVHEDEEDDDDGENLSEENQPELHESDTHWIPNIEYKITSNTIGNSHGNIKQDLDPGLHQAERISFEKDSKNDIQDEQRCSENNTFPVDDASRFESLSEDCTKTITNQQRIENMLQRLGGKGTFKCRICQQSFRCDRVLQTHMRSHLGEKLYTCEDCGQQFAHASSLCRHRKSHLGEENPYRCDMCDKYFTSSTNLRQHKNTHTGERPYRCNICAADFVYSHSLSTHKRVHHSDCSSNEEVVGRKSDLSLPSLDHWLPTELRPSSMDTESVSYASTVQERESALPQYTSDTNISLNAIQEAEGVPVTAGQNMPLVATSGESSKDVGGDWPYRLHTFGRPFGYPQQVAQHMLEMLGMDVANQSIPTPAAQEKMAEMAHVQPTL